MERRGELVGIHRGGAEISDLVAADGVVEGSERLGDRRAVIPTVDLVEVDRIHAEPVETPLQILFDRLPGEAVPAVIGAQIRLGRRIRLRAALGMGLRRNDEFVPIVFVDGVAENSLGLAVRVDVGRVEEIDPEFDRPVDQFLGVLLLEQPVGPSGSEAHAAETDPTDGQSCIAEFGVLHTRDCLDEGNKRIEVGSDGVRRADPNPYSSWPRPRRQTLASPMSTTSSLVSGDLLLFFIIGLLGGAHCIGMCGPLVTIYSNKLNERTDEPRGHLTLYEVRQHSLFNLGRTLSYATIGAACGALGGLLYVTTDTLTAVADTIRGSMGIVVGGFVIVVGIYYLIGRSSVGGHVSGLGFERLFGVLSARLDELAAGPGIVGLGALHGLLPCPILYPAFLYAFAVGSWSVGFLSLAALGLGTFPAVFLYGTVVEAVDPVRRGQLHRLLGGAFVLLGYVLFAHGLMSFGVHLPHPRLPHYQPFADAALLP